MLDVEPYRLIGRIGMGGLDVLKAVVPAQPLDFNVALALVVGSFISAGTLTADFVRFGRNAKLAVLVAMVAFFLGNSLMFIFGAAGAAALGMADISDVMIAQGLLLPAIVVLGHTSYPIPSLSNSSICSLIAPYRQGSPV